MSKSNREVIAELRAKARELGMCIGCRCRAAKPGCVTCQTCLDASAERKRAAIAAARASGDTCPCCCARDSLPGRKLCETCTLRYRAAMRRRYAAKDARGECRRCSRPAAQGVFCSAHADENRARVAEWAAKYRPSKTLKEAA